jgi:hypothetical protein
VVLGTEAGRDPFSGLGLPRAVEDYADLPDAAAGADEPAIVEVDIGVADYDVDIKVGVEPKLRAALVLAAVTVCWRMRRRARLIDYDGRARAGRQENSVAAAECDDYHRCGKKLCETKHGRYPQIRAIGRSRFRLDGRRLVSSLTALTQGLVYSATLSG